MSRESRARILQIDAREITKVDLMNHLVPTLNLLFKTSKFFFTHDRFSSNSPLKGFLISGPVGTGKTELVKQVARTLAVDLQHDSSVKLVPIDSSTLASPRWGESEEVLQDLFALTKRASIDDGSKEEHEEDKKVVMLFDDLESLILTRGMQAAREWHYSLSSVLFHLIDMVNPYKALVFATTNRVDLLDSAIATRLYNIQVPNVKIEDLLGYADSMFDSILGQGHSRKRETLSKVQEKLKAMREPTIRDARQLVIVSCIEDGLLS